MDLAFIGVAAAVNLDNGIVTGVRIGLAAVAPTPIRATGAENLLRGNELTAELLEQAGEAAAAAVQPDIRFTMLRRTSQRNGRCAHEASLYKRLLQGHKPKYLFT